jgi:hypothetical protein
MNILHILNVADCAFIAAGVFAALAMMVIGEHGEEPRAGRAEDGSGRRRRRRRS